MLVIIFISVCFLYAYMIGDFADGEYNDWVDRHLNEKEK